MTTKRYQPGMNVFVHHRRNMSERPDPAKLEQRWVTKVGREWITLDNNLRFNPATMWLNEPRFGNVGTVYHSREECAEKITLATVWDDFRSRVGYEPPKDVTLENVKAAAQLLGLPLKSLAELP